jgi:hypothetical protein
MIAITSPAMPQPASLSPRFARPRRQRSPEYHPAAYHRHGRHEKYDPIADTERHFAMLYPSKSAVMVLPTPRQQTLATLKSP